MREHLTQSLDTKRQQAAHLYALLDQEGPSAGLYKVRRELALKRTDGMGRKARSRNKLSSLKCKPPARKTMMMLGWPFWSNHARCCNKAARKAVTLPAKLRHGAAARWFHGDFDSHVPAEQASQRPSSKHNMQPVETTAVYMGSPTYKRTEYLSSLTCIVDAPNKSSSTRTLVAVGMPNRLLSRTVASNCSSSCFLLERLIGFSTAACALSTAFVNTLLHQHTVHQRLPACSHARRACCL